MQFKEDGSSETYYVSAGLEKLVLSEGLETLPYGAFYNCNMLKELVFPRPFTWWANVPCTGAPG